MSAHDGHARGAALLMEIADVLNQAGHLRCTPTVETSDDGVVLTVTVPVEGQDDSEAALRALEMLNGLRYLCGLAQVRAFATDYGIDAAALEKLLPHKEE